MEAHHTNSRQVRRLEVSNVETETRKPATMLVNLSNLPNVAVGTIFSTT